MFEPIYQISPPLLTTIKQITLLIHELNQRVFPDVVLAQFQAEAEAISTYASTSIEGNPLPLTEVKQLLKNHPEQTRQSEREILNYNRALVELSQQWTEPLTQTMLLHIHQQVMDSLLPPHQVGRMRLEPVIIHDPRTRQVVYLPPDHADVPSLVDALLKFVQANRTAMDPVVLAGLFHRQLVVIHPFIDGNGRPSWWPN